MEILFYILFPLVLVGVAAALGVGTAVYFTGGFAPQDIPSMAVIISSGVVIVAIASVAVASSEEWRELFGAEIMDYLWAFCLVAFVLGCVFGARVPSTQRSPATKTGA
ncbi:MAG: hypothetical protein WAN86_06525, partial [Hyphomicrobiaceae bacterium]